MKTDLGYPVKLQIRQKEEDMTTRECQNLYPG